MEIRGKMRASSDIPTASMADIAFLLIIFFLVSTTMNLDKGLGLELPAPGKPQEVSRKNLSNIWINAAGNIMIDMEPVALQDLEAIIRQKLADNDKLVFSVKTQREAQYHYMIDVLDELQKAGASRISLASPEVE